MAGIDELSAIEGRPTSELIADRLREHILSGAFQPGEQVTEAQFATKLQVSRGPVREALQRLSQEGLLVSHRNRGVFVLDLAVVDVVEIYAAREAIEIAAAAALLAAPRDRIDRTVQELTGIVGQMPDMVSAGDWSQLAQLDLSFHSALVAGSANSRLIRIYATLAAESRICIVNLKGSYPSLDRLVIEHQKILTLVEEARGPELRREITRHMKSAVNDLSVSMQGHAE